MTKKKDDFDKLTEQSENALLMAWLVFLAVIGACIIIVGIFNI